MEIITALLIIVFGPPLALCLFGAYFHKLSHLAGLTGPARWARLGWLVALASGATGSFYLLVLVVSAQLPSAHAASRSAWPWGHEHPIAVVLLGGLVATLAIGWHRAQRLAGLSFGTGVALVAGGLGLHWYLTDHQKDLMQDLRQSAAAYDRMGWQRAATDSFEVQLTRRHDIDRLYLSDPVFPGGEPALQRQLKALSRPPRTPLPADAVVDVEFILERDGRCTLPHVVYGLGPGYDEDAVRVVQALPSFSPATNQEGKPVASVWRVQVPYFHKGLVVPGQRYLNPC